jgi:hypothetical protein
MTIRKIVYRTEHKAVDAPALQAIGSAWDRLGGALQLHWSGTVTMG